MGQNEFVRPADFGMGGAASELAGNVAFKAFMEGGNTAANRQKLAEYISEGQGVSENLNDDLLNAVRDQYRRFTEERNYT